MAKKFTVSIIGCGSRGAFAYGRTMKRLSEQWEIVALCDTDEEKIEIWSEQFGIKEENCFTDERTFFAEKRSDVLVLATQDRDHVRMCIRALELGYSVLLEKPITPLKEELERLLEAHKKYGGEVVVCHVLRYAPMFVRVKRILDSGELGKLVRIESIEQVGYWHQAHSFVRGNWRNDSETSPMIMAKCCHDLDLLQYYASSKGKRVYSVGELSYFNAENKPEGAAERCADCKYIHTCPYSAEKCYVENWKKDGRPENTWPYNVISVQTPHTEERLRKAYTESAYGRCVFACDNNVVDNQSVSILFENGVKADLTMTAFTQNMGRRMTFHCVHGEIRLKEDEELLEVQPFGKPLQVFKSADIIAEDAKDSFGHGGGDSGVVTALYRALTGEAETGTSLENSVESHLLALAAEESRKTGQVVVLR
ncbi:MAG: Gfo/Idh/MocA family oxidoreductase [Clostridia bacterium]|nr:Gfo/Idh/MocA family oxidoreductase [Clostridia bacterium]